jgi:hypothetical protein
MTFTGELQVPTDLVARCSIVRPTAEQREEEEDDRKEEGEVREGGEIRGESRKYTKGRAAVAVSTKDGAAVGRSTPRRSNNKDSSGSGVRSRVRDGSSIAAAAIDTSRSISGSSFQGTPLCFSYVACYA